MINQNSSRKGNNPRILYCVSSIGLGHARRSLEIARELRTRRKEIEIDWIGAEPVFSFLERSGERSLDVSSKLQSLGLALERGSKEGKIRDISRAARLSAKIAKKNYELIRPLLSSYDILVQDEFVETLFSFLWEASPPVPGKSAIITDHVRYETKSMNPINRLIVAYANRALRRAFLRQKLRIFADDFEALPFESGIRKWVAENFEVAGPVISAVSGSKAESKQKLFSFQGNDKLIVFTVGGTSIGRPLVEFVAQNAKEISSALNAHLAILPGPALNTDSFPRSEYAAIVPFTTDSLLYFKAADCVVAQAGASTLNEVASIGTPCVAIPIANHWEQRHNARRFAKQYNFQTLEYTELSIENLTRIISAAMSEAYTPHESFGASAKISGLIADLLDDRN